MSAPALEARSAMDRMYRRQRHVYDATRKFYLLGRDDLIDALAVPEGGTVLEIACGTGRNLIRAARKYPQARFYGLDVSEEMLTTARANVARAGLSRRIALARGDAAALDAQSAFGLPSFHRVFVSYALSMIPPWREVLPRALAATMDEGELHVVDFGDCAELPSGFRRLLGAWLTRFGVHPRDELEPELKRLAAARGLTAQVLPLYRGYACRARLFRR